MRVGPSRDIAGGEYTRRARLEELVHQNAAVHREPGLFRDCDCRPDADAHHNEVAVDGGAPAERHGAPIDPRHRLAQVERDAVFLVKRSDEPAHFDAHDLLEWGILRRDDIDGDVAGAQRGRDLQSDKARANHDHVLGFCGRVTIARLSANDRRYRTRSSPHRDRQPHRVGTSREKQGARSLFSTFWTAV